MAKSSKMKKPTKAEIKAAKSHLKANAKNAKAKKAAKKAANKRPKKGFKLSTATKKKIGAKSRAHWKRITGNGRPGGKGGNHIPLEQLRRNHIRLGKTIALREKSPAAWA